MNSYHEPILPYPIYDKKFYIPMLKRMPLCIPFIFKTQSPCSHTFFWETAISLFCTSFKTLLQLQQFFVCTYSWCTHEQKWHHDKFSVQWLTFSPQPLTNKPNFSCCLLSPVCVSHGDALQLRASSCLWDQSAVPTKHKYLHIFLPPTEFSLWWHSDKLGKEEIPKARPYDIVVQYITSKQHQCLHVYPYQGSHSQVFLKSWYVPSIYIMFV